MADIVSPQRRSRLMAGVNQKNTAPELRLRRRLHALGFRFRLNVSHLPGRPDIVLPRYATAIFVHGCFWHGHACRAGRLPTSNTEFWREKQCANKRRDRRKSRALRALGWHVLTVWECHLRGEAKADATAERVAGSIRRNVTEQGAALRLNRPSPPRP